MHLQGRPFIPFSHVIDQKRRNRAKKCHFGVSMILDLIQGENTVLAKIALFPIVSELHRSCLVSKNHGSCKCNGEVTSLNNKRFPVSVDHNFLEVIRLYLHKGYGQRLQICVSIVLISFILKSHSNEKYRRCSNRYDGSPLPISSATAYGCNC